MQPQAPYSGPPMPPSPQQPYNGNPGPSPDYSFLNDQPKKSRGLPVFGNSFLGKIILILMVAFLVVIILIVVKGIVSPAPFNKNAYEIVLERQHEMLHILGTDVTSNAQTQLTQADQNFASTANLALTTAQAKTLTYLADYGDKVDQKKLATVFDASIDQNLSSSIASNSFDTAFKTQMQQQIISYQHELKTAYATTRTPSGKALLLSEYQEAKQLLTALSSSSS